MDRINFKITGAKEMEALLKQMGPRLASRAGDQSLRAGARIIVAEAKRLAPVRTGALRRSITMASQRQPSGSSRRVVLVGFRPPVSRRAHFTEFGTRHSPAEPFLRPAFDVRAVNALSEIGRVLALAIETIAKGAR
jgi:HK97 gp10 family phage protein